MITTLLTARSPIIYRVTSRAVAHRLQTTVETGMSDDFGLVVLDVCHLTAGRRKGRSLVEAGRMAPVSPFTVGGSRCRLAKRAAIRLRVQMDRGRVPTSGFPRCVIPVLADVNRLLTTVATAR